jgi:RNA polymerase sigma factor (sigma-70 family)
MDNQPLRTVIRFLQDMRGRDALLSDYELLGILTEKHDNNAFAIIVRRHGPMVLSVCRRMLRNECDAEDAFQATFLFLAKKPGAIRRGESLHSWLYKVAFRVSQRLRLKLARQQTSEIPTELADPKIASDTLSWSEVRAALDEELQKLPEKFRAPLVLCCLSGKTRDEAAEELGLTLNVLKGRLERGRKRLQARLLRRGVELSAVLLGITVTQHAGAASLPLALIATTLQMSAAVAGTTGVSSAASSRVFQLMEGEMRAASLAPVTTMNAVALALVAVASFVAAGLTYFPAGPGETENRIQSAEFPSNPAFRDVTRESGLAQIVEDKFAANPKWFLSGLHLLDLDGDGHLDFFMSAPGLRKSGSVAALNDGKGHFTRAEGSYPPTELRLAHDLDEDGKLDLCFTFQDGGGQWWLNKSRPGALKFDATTITREADTARRQALIDINRDGKVDWIRGTPEALEFDLADGKGGFTAGAGKLPLGDDSDYERLCLPVDLNGDGFIDFVVEWGHFDDKFGCSRLFRNDGKMNFTDVTKESGLPEKNLAIKGVADVNQDGFPDLIVLEDLKPAIYLNDGKGRFTKLPNAFAGMEAASTPEAASWGIAVMTDFDNDGIPDLLWNGKQFLWVLRGIGGGRFEYANAKWGIKDMAVASVDDGHCFGDINGDGWLDIIGYTSTERQHRFAVYENNLPRENNWLRVRPIGLAGNKGAAGAKIRVSDSKTGKLLWSEQVAIHASQSAQSYYGLAETERHYGLGRRTTVDVQVEFYPSGQRVKKKNVAANDTVRITEKVAGK